MHLVTALCTTCLFIKLCFYNAKYVTEKGLITTDAVVEAKRALDMISIFVLGCFFDSII